jgi:hypothetical protein
MKEKFDIYIKRLPKREPSISVWKENLCGIPNEKRLILKLALPKIEACQIVKEIDGLGGLATLIPFSYREPKTSIEDARVLAQQELDKLNMVRGTNFELADIVESYIFCWGFNIKGSVEGSPAFPVDFCSGQIFTSEKWGELTIICRCD